MAIHVLGGYECECTATGKSSSTGEKNLLDSDIPALAANSPDGAFARQDLVDAIAGGNFPEWYLYIQTLDPADQDKYDFDPLDVTKVRPTCTRMSPQGSPLPVSTCSTFLEGKQREACYF